MCFNVVLGNDTLNHNLIECTDYSTWLCLNTNDEMIQHFANQAMNLRCSSGTEVCDRLLQVTQQTVLETAITLTSLNRVACSVRDNVLFSSIIVHFSEPVSLRIVI